MNEHPQNRGAEQRPDAASVPAYRLTYDDKQGRFSRDDGEANRPEVFAERALFGAT